MSPPGHSVGAGTSSSFSAAAALDLPLSSHGPTHLPSLARGAACRVCRNRKVKCDGVKPTCGACRRSAVAHGEDPAQLPHCNFDEEERGGVKRKRASGTSKVAALEAKIAELERTIEQQQNQAPQAAYSMPQPLPRHFPSTSSSSSSFVRPDPNDSPFSSSAHSFGSTSRSNLDVLLQATSHHMPDFMHDNPNSIPDAPGHLTSNGIFFAENAAPMAYLPPDSLYHHALSTSFPLARAPPPPFSASPPASPPDPLLEIFYPGWPQSLPTPLLVMRLIDVYFQKPHAASGMVNQAKFLTSMSLPPTHSKFPHVSLIHAMLATAARMVGPTFFAQEEKYWGLEDREQTVADYHAKKSMVAIDTAIAKGQSLLQVAQSIVLICLWSFTAARFVEVWVYIGLATRLSTPLGLNHIRAVQLWNDGTSGDRPPHMKANILPATGDEEELYERAATFWLGVVCDRFASASTGWSMGIDELDITSLLPSPGSTYSTGDLMSSPLSPHNPSFIMSHPPHLVHCFQLYLKAVILLGRVVSFMQRAPSPVGMGPNAPDPRRNPSSQPNPGSKPVDLRTTPEFKALDADAVTFRLSVPREMQASMHTSADVRMVLVFVVPHITTILLHEPFCTLAEDDVSLARCLLSARAVLEMVYTLLGTSFEVSLLPPFICFCWAVVGRTLVRELAIKEATGKTSGVEQLKMDVQTIIIAMRAYRSPLGDSVSTALQTLLDSPARCLPHEDLGVAGLACGTNGPMSVAYGRLCQADDGSTPCPFTGSKKRAYANGGEAEPEASGELPVEVDYAALFSQQEGATPDDDRFKELLGMGSIEGMMSGGWSPEVA